MQLVAGAGTVPAMPAPLQALAAGWFAQVTPGVGTPTVITVDWLNALQAELTNVIEAAGLTLNGTEFNQLLQAIVAIAAGPSQTVFDTSLVANTITAVLTPPIQNYAAGQFVRLIPANTVTGPAVINLNGVGPIPATRINGAPLEPGDLQKGIPSSGIVLSSTVNGVTTFSLALLQIITPGTYAADTGAVNQLAIALSPAMTAYLAGTPIRFTTAITNTGAATIAVNGLPPIPISRSDGNAVAKGDLPGGIGQMGMINAAGSGLQLLAPSPSLYTAVATAPFGGALTPIAGATHTYAAADATKAIQRSNAGAAMIDLLPGATAGALANGWSGTIINTDATALLAIQVGAGSTIAGPAVVNNMLVLGPGEMAIVASNGINYQAWGWVGRAKLTANLTIFVATAGSDATGTGLTAASAYATLQHAYNWAQSALDLGGFQLTISIGAGAYASNATLNGPIVGQTNSVILNGAGAGTVITSAVGAVLAVANGAIATLQNMTLNASATAPGSGCIGAGSGASGGASTVFIGPGMSFGGGTFGHMVVDGGGRIVLASSYTIISGSGAHWFTEAGGIIDNGNTTITVTLTGTPAFTQAFAVANSLGLINPLNDITFNGAATGPRYLVSAGAVINTAGSGASYLPGSVAGTGTNYF
jgi:hypothetical protein